MDKVNLAFTYFTDVGWFLITDILLYLSCKYYVKASESFFLHFNYPNMDTTPLKLFQICGWHLHPVRIFWSQIYNYILCL